jgi:tetratricopeptide (TPR) repeat protein
MCKKILGSLGFKCKGQNFYRIVNDVLQVVVLQRYSDGDTFSVRFSLLPFCCGLDELCLKDAELELGWIAKLPTYEDKSDEALQRCVCVLGDLFCKNLLHIFEYVSDAATAYEETRRIYNLHEHLNESERHISILEATILMKLGNYDLAIKAYESQIVHLEDAYKTNYEWARTVQAQHGRKVNVSEQLSTEYKAYFTNQINECKQIIQHLLSHDVDWINNFIAANERKSRIALGLEPEPDG